MFLIHNVNFDWAFRINGPMWSVATEWQIYFLLPFVLIPLWRRFGPLVTVVVAWAVPTILYFAIPTSSNLYWAAPWFVGSFALGMWGAHLGYSPTVAGDRWRRIPWGSLTVAALAAIVLVLATGNSDWPPPLTDGIVSIFAVAWIMACVVRVSVRSEDPGHMVKALSVPALVYVGGFSYSIYLLQHPLLRLSEKLLAELPLTDDQILTVQLLIGTPIILGIAWVFGEFFERPFTGHGVILPYVKARWAARRGGAEVAPPSEVVVAASSSVSATE